MIGFCMPNLSRSAQPRKYSLGAAGSTPADRQAVVDKVAFKNVMRSWRLNDTKRRGLNTRQWTRYHLMNLGLGKNLGRIRPGGKDYVIAPDEVVTLALSPQFSFAPFSRYRLI